MSAPELRGLHGQAKRTGLICIDYNTLTNLHLEMKNNRYKTKEELARELGMSRSTLYRRLAKAKVPISGELLSPSEQETLVRAIESHRKEKRAIRRFNGSAPDETN